MNFQRIVAVDASQQLLLSLSRVLVFKIDLHTASTIGQILPHLRGSGEPPVAIVGQTGVPLTRAVSQILKVEPDTRILALATPTQFKEALSLVNQGQVSRILQYPCSTHDIEREVQFILLTPPTSEAIAAKIVARTFQMITDLQKLSDGTDLFLGLEKTCRLIIERTQGTYSPEIDTAIQVFPAGFALLAEDEQSSLRTAAIGSPRFELSFRRLCLTLSKLLDRLDDYHQNVARLLVMTPFADRWYQKSKQPTKRLAVVLRVAAITCLLRNQGIQGAAFDDLMGMYFRYVGKRMRNALASLPLHAINETVIPVSELQVGMVLLDPIRFQSGRLPLSAGTRLTSDIFQIIKKEIQVSTSRQITVASQSIDRSSVDRPLENYYVAPSSQTFPGDLVNCQIWTRQMGQK